jgi:hypothetical protein
VVNEEIVNKRFLLGSCVRILPMPVQSWCQKWRSSEDRGAVFDVLLALLFAKLSNGGAAWVREQAEALAAESGRCDMEVLIHLLCRQLSATALAQTSRELEVWCQLRGCSIRADERPLPQR